MDYMVGNLLIEHEDKKIDNATLNAYQQKLTESLKNNTDKEN